MPYAITCVTKPSASLPRHFNGSKSQFNFAFANMTSVNHKIRKKSIQETSRFFCLLHSSRAQTRQNTNSFLVVNRNNDRLVRWNFWCVHTIVHMKPMAQSLEFQVKESERVSWKISEKFVASWEISNALSESKECGRCSPFELSFANMPLFVLYTGPMGNQSIE